MHLAPISSKLRYYQINLVLLFRPPSFKQVTPSCRTNVRQLLHREQWLQHDQRNRHLSSNASQEGVSGNKRQNRTNSHHETDLSCQVIRKENFIE